MKILESIKEQLLLLISLCRQEIFKVKTKEAMAVETVSGNHIDVYKTEWKRNHFKELWCIIHSTPYNSSLAMV